MLGMQREEMRYVKKRREGSCREGEHGRESVREKMQRGMFHAVVCADEVRSV